MEQEWYFDNDGALWVSSMDSKHISTAPQVGEQAQPVADKLGDRIQGAAKQVAQQAPKVADDASARVERAAETVAKEAPKRAAALSDVLEGRVCNPAPHSGCFRVWISKPSGLRHWPGSSQNTY